FLLIGILVGAVSGYFFALNKGTKDAVNIQSIQIEKARLEQDIQSAALRKNENELRLAELENQNQNLLQENAVLRTEGLGLQQRMAEQKQELEQLNEHMSLQFKNLANEILEEK